jgi:hypothetical protein
MALELPGTTSGAHMGHPDFRVNGKIFATLRYPDENWGMVKLPVEHQHGFIQTQPDAFVPVKGAWGRQGCTSVRLSSVDENSLEEALRLAWAKARAPKPAPKSKQTRPPR